MAFGSAAGTTGSSTSTGSSGARPPEAALASVKRTRTFFPETWLWREVPLGAAAAAALQLTTADTITTWDVMAFAQSPGDGLGFAETSLRVFKSFFVRLALPASALRTEGVAAVATVYNYEPGEVTVRLELTLPAGLNVTGDRVRTVTVPGNSAQSTTYMLGCNAVGLHPLRLTGQTLASVGLADAVQRMLRVRPEGIERVLSYSKLMDVTAGAPASLSIPLQLPKDTVADSAHATVSITGDLMGAPLSGLEGLLRQPFGCGEQTMITLAPNVYALRYTSATGTATAEFTERATRNIRSGYVRELRYRHGDGSFSAFGERDDSGSSWLTAFVLKVFAEASEFAFIDPAVLTAAAGFLADTQKSGGAFPKVGTVCHDEMMGGAAGADGERAMTAFVGIALTEALDVLPAGAQKDRVRTAVQSAASYLVKGPTGPLQAGPAVYTACVRAYALQLMAKRGLATPAEAAAALDVVKAAATDDGGLANWNTDAAAGGSAKARATPECLGCGGHWRRPMSTSIEATAYATLALVQAGDMGLAYSAAKWLVSQQSETGAFRSTQDTIVGLQALAEYGAAIAAAKPTVAVVIEDGAGTTQQVQVDAGTWNVLQTREVAPTGTVAVSATGTGKVIALTTLKYNVPRDPEPPIFNLTTGCVFEGADRSRARCRFCTSLAPGQGSLTGQVMMELGLFTGYAFDTASISSLLANTRLKRIDQDQGKTQVCP